MVEGLTDAVFFEEVFRRLYLRETESQSIVLPGTNVNQLELTGLSGDGHQITISFRNVFGKHNTPAAMETLLNAKVEEFVVSQDIDYGTPDDISKSINRRVFSSLGLAEPDPVPVDYTVSVLDSTVHTIPMGLPENQTLSGFGIRKHEMEDYLILLALQNPDLKNEIPELELLISDILPLIRNRDGQFDAAKDVFHVLRPIVLSGASDIGMVQKLVRGAESEAIRSTLNPLLSDIENAFSVAPLES